VNGLNGFDAGPTLSIQPAPSAVETAAVVAVLLALSAAAPAPAPTPAGRSAWAASARARTAFGPGSSWRHSDRTSL
jgi:hypothetical protein